MKATLGELLKKRAQVTLGRRTQGVHTSGSGNVPSGLLNSSLKTSTYSEREAADSVTHNSPSPAKLTACADETATNKAIKTIASICLLRFFRDIFNKDSTVTA